MRKWFLKRNPYLSSSRLIQLTHLNLVNSHKIHYTKNKHLMHKKIRYILHYSFLKQYETMIISNNKVAIIKP